MRLSESIIADAYEPAVAKPTQVEFCIYTPDQPDYWGQFNTGNEMRAYLKQHYPDHQYDSKISNAHYARYHAANGVLIVITGM